MKKISLSKNDLMKNINGINEFLSEKGLSQIRGGNTSFGGNSSSGNTANCGTTYTDSTNYSKSTYVNQPPPQPIN